MPRKPARMYTQIRGQPYTRKEYMGGIPNIRIAQFEMGNAKAEYPLKMHLIAEERCQVRDIALEAARISANRYLQKRLGMMNYHVKIRVFPHCVLRENKQATGAGADRVSEGRRMPLHPRCMPGPYPVWGIPRAGRGESSLSARARGRYPWCPRSSRRG